MASIESISATFLQECAELRELLCIVACMLFVVGNILFVLHAFSPKTMMLHVVRLLILTGVLVCLPDCVNRVQELLHKPSLNGLGIDPANVQDHYNQLLVIKRDKSEERSWWDILSDLPSFTMEQLISGILWLLGHFASLLLFWAYV